MTMLKTVAKGGLKLIASILAEKAAEKAVEKAVEKVIAHVIGEPTERDFSNQLKLEIPRLVSEIASATGSRRTVLQENLTLAREQLALLSRLTSEQAEIRTDQEQHRKRLVEIQAEQEQLLSSIDSLASRMEALERRVDRIDSRVDELDSRLRQVEEALIRECLDLRSAAVLGVDEYRVKETPGGWMSDRFDSDELTLDVRLLLNSCTADLTRRGLVIQLSLVTRNLDQDLRLYATWKDVSVDNYGQGPRRYDRQEFPLAQPVYRLDGQVAELFIPYDEIPGFGSADRLALALVLTHDGTVLYSLPDRLVSCNFGQRVQCRWGR